jgi:hypothetical protein
MRLVIFPKIDGQCIWTRDRITYRERAFEKDLANFDERGLNVLLLSAQELTSGMAAREYEDQLKMIVERLREFQRVAPRFSAPALISVPKGLEQVLNERGEITVQKFIVDSEKALEQMKGRP